MCIGDFVINSNDLKLDNTEFGIKYAMTLNVYKILSLEEDGGYIDVVDINTNKEVRARKNCLIKVY